LSGTIRDVRASLHIRVTYSVRRDGDVFDKKRKRGDLQTAHRERRGAQILCTLRTKKNQQKEKRGGESEVVQRIGGGKGAKVFRRIRVSLESIEFSVFRTGKKALNAVLLSRRPECRRRERTRRKNFSFQRGV